MFNPTEIIALLGATGSFIAIIHNFYRDLIDRERLEISAQVFHVHTAKDCFNSMIITVKNIGKRPIQLCDQYLSFKDNSKLYFYRYLEKYLGNNEIIILKEAEPQTHHNNLTQNDANYIFCNKNFKTIIVEDSKGKKWKMSNKAKKVLFNSYKENFKTISNDGQIATSGSVNPPRNDSYVNSEVRCL